MSDQPGPSWPFGSAAKSVLDPDQPLGGAFGAAFGTTSATAWPAANRALYMPIEIAEPTLVQTLLIIVGTASGNLDAGIYSEQGSKIVGLGSTAAVAGVMVLNIADTLLSPGIYFAALIVDNTTCTVTASATMSSLTQEICGMQQQATSIPLPSTATFANTAAAYVPVMALSRLAV